MKRNKKLQIIKAMLLDGKTVVSIANTLDTSPQLVYWYIKKYKLERKSLTKF
jgi:transposase-like protein